MSTRWMTIPLTRWGRASWYTLLGLLGVVLFIGLNAAMLSRVVVPEYDALTYVDSAMRLSLGLTDGRWDLIRPGLPVTNTLDVLFVALLYNVLDYHLTIWLVHSAYLVLFAWLAARLLGTATGLVLFACAITHAFFLHQYVNLVSEMKVGMMLALFIAYLFHEDVARHRTALFWITILLLLERTINLLFVVPLVGMLVVLRWRGRRAEAFAALQATGLAVLVLSPLLAWGGAGLIEHTRGVMASGMMKNWQDMSGVYSKLDLFKSYKDGVLAYHRALGYLFGLALVGGAALLVASRGRSPRYFRDSVLAFAVAFAVLMQASTNNTMVVYWVFILAALCFALLLRHLLPERFLALAGMGIAALAVWQTGLNFLDHNRDLARGRPVIEMAKALAGHIAKTDSSLVMYSNFGGAGALDPQGFEVALRRTIMVPQVDAISYGTPVSTYIEAMKHANLALVANRSFLWPTYIGVNGKTAEIAAVMDRDSGSIGLVKVERVLFDGDSSRYIDVYVRPSVTLKPFPDSWLGAETPVLLKAPGDALTGFVLDVDVTIPGGVDDPAFTFPFAATLVDTDGRELGSAKVGGSGAGTLSFALDGVAPGAYLLRFAKTFRAGTGDDRRLSVAYRGARLRYAAGPK